MSRLKWEIVTLLSLGVLLAGCGGGSGVRVGGASNESISFYENRSVDLAVREDFDKALELLHKEQFEEAIKLLQKVIQKSQNNSAPYINIALAYEETGEMGLAEDNLKKALVINPNHPAAMNEYALLYRRTGRFAEAKKLYESLLDKFPSFMPARKNLGVLCELYLNDYRCALEQYESYISAFPDDEEVKLWIVGVKQKPGA
jgi:tetratricopeptide (TPR) repeat protein